jgi:hypothetical protein
MRGGLAAVRRAAGLAVKWLGQQETIVLLAALAVGLGLFAVMKISRGVAFCHNLLFRSINCDTKQDENDDRRGAGRRSRHEDDQEHEKDGTRDSPHADKTSESESHLLFTAS